MFNCFNKLKKRKNYQDIKKDPLRDEYYTLNDTVEDILNPVLDYIKDKKIYLPCDSEKSEFVKYMKKYNLNYKNTSDNFLWHDDLWQWADIIITNPPFSMETVWVKRILQFNKKAIFIFNLWLRNHYLNGKYKNANISDTYDIMRNFNYLRPDNTISYKIPSTVYFININNIKGKYYDKAQRKN